MKAKTFAELRKHGDHDQSDHGNWSDGSSGEGKAHAVESVNPKQLGEVSGGGIASDLDAWPDGAARTVAYAAWSELKHDYDTQDYPIKGLATRDNAGKVNGIAAYMSKQPGSMMVLHVAARDKQQGVGRTLVEQMQRIAAKERRSIALTSSESAIPFYEKMGFKADSTSENKNIMYMSRTAVQQRIKQIGKVEVEEPDTGVFTSVCKAGGLYVRRQLVNAQQLHDWAKQVGIPNLVPPEQMHVTVVYSKKKIELVPETDSVRVVGGARSIEPLGDKGALVLMAPSAVLSARWEYAREQGATWQYSTGYRPHVTLSYDAGGVDIQAITPPDMELTFGPEIHEEINEGWAEDNGLRLAKTFSELAKDLTRADVHVATTFGQLRNKKKKPKTFNQIRKGGDHDQKEHGNWADGRAFSSQSAAREHGLGEVLLYHGTSSAALASIQKEGILIGKSSGGDAWAAKHGWTTVTGRIQSRPASVYIAKDRKAAAAYAKLASEMAPGS